MQSESAEHGAMPHEPFKQLFPDAHSFPPGVQVAKHVLASLQTKGLHVVALGVTQAPKPSQVEAAMTLLVVASHVEALHGVLSAHSRHDPVPSHVPSCWQVAFGSLAHEVCPASGAEPAGTGEQMPMVPIRSQAWHESAQLESQHTPSTHPPAEPHSEEERHRSPRPLSESPFTSAIVVPSVVAPPSGT
jgi:hypothetical protein